MNDETIKNRKGGQTAQLSQLKQNLTERKLNEASVLKDEYQNL